MGLKPSSSPLLLLLAAAKVALAAGGCIVLDTKVQCSGVHRLSDVLREDVVSGNTTDLARVTSLTLRNADLASICLDDLTHLPALTSLYIAYSRLGEWLPPSRPTVPRVSHLHLDASWDTHTDQIQGMLMGPDDVTSWKTLNTSQVVHAIPALRELHLTDCYVLALEFQVLKTMQKTALDVLSIQGGGLVCEVSNLWLLFWMESGQVKVSNTTVCIAHDSLHPARSRFDGVAFLTVMAFIKDAKQDCPSQCHCEVTGLYWTDMIIGVPLAIPEPMQWMQCKNQHLTQLPAKIPHRTNLIRLSNNNITNLDPLFTSEMYSRVFFADLHANHITHLDGDLFYEFLKKRSSFQMSLDLDYNRLDILPMAVFRRIYDEMKEDGMEHQSLLIRVRHNQLRCDDCGFISAVESFQRLLHPLVEEEKTVGGFKFISELVCSAPDKYAGTWVKQVRPDDVCGGLYHIPQHLHALAITLGVVVALIATLVIIFTFRARAQRSTAFRLM